MHEIIILLLSVFTADICCYTVGVDRAMKWQFYFMFIAAEKGGWQDILSLLQLFPESLVPCSIQQILVELISFRNTQEENYKINQKIV